MTAEDQKAFEDEIYAFVGREVCPPTPARDDVNTAMIRQWTEIIGDTNPAYTDAGWAANSARGKTIAPPAMMYVWGQEGFAVTTGRPADAQSDLVSLFNQHGYTGVLGTNVKQEYFKEVSPGDNVVMAMTIDNISERKTTGRGPGYFFETLATFTNQHGETIGTIGEARKTGFNPVFLGSSAAYTELIHKLGGKAMDGLYATMGAQVPYLDEASQPLRFWATK